MNNFDERKDLSNPSPISRVLLTDGDQKRRRDHGDLVSANNEINSKLNRMPEVTEEVDNEDEIDDDWFLKLSNSKEGSRVPAVNGPNCVRIPELCEENADFREKTMKTLRDGLKKIWKRGSATITVEDPTYKVLYLGNVLTGWAKGEGCIEKPLSSLWKNYTGSSKPDIQMKITVTQSGLKAVTKDHGLIEYWSHRITYCSVPASLPRVFCWIYRHEGRKLKQELRCHAILCSKESMATQMATTLKLRLAQALLEFKRDKLLRQNARLSLANSVYDNPSLPRRKILLSTGSHNYKPPLERSKSAPKLTSIEESLEEEENTPKAKRKLSNGTGGGGGVGVGVNEEKSLKDSSVREVENRLSRTNPEDKCEYKLTNLNFVKKLCSSIENLVESTSNYGKKFFSERKLNKEICPIANKLEESKLKKSDAEDEGEEVSIKFKPKKNVMFNGIENSDSIKCTEFKRLEEDEMRPTMEITLEVRDQESDEGSNSLQSISSCCSDGSSLVTTSSEKSYSEASHKTEANSIFAGGDHDLIGCESSMERLESYLNTCSDMFMDEVILHPTGESQDEKKLSLKARETEDEDEDDDEDDDGDESFDNVERTGYVDLTENLVKRLNLDSKEKDIPYHKIIKSTGLNQTRIQSSCLHI